MSGRFTLVAGATLGTLCACSSQPQSDINALVGSSPAATALSYVAALDPTISGYLGEADSAVAANAPKVLSDACGAVAMGNEIVSTIETIDPKLIPAATQQAIAASVTAAEPLCPPNPAPANVAEAAKEMLSLYAALARAWAGAGVSLPADD